MKKLLLISMILGLALAMSSTCFAIEIAMEAEFAEVIMEPMVVGVPADAAAQGGPEPSEPSRGQFVWQPGPPVTGGGGEGYMQFVIDIPVAGTYAAWGKIVAWDGNSDSFWVTWQPSDPDEDPQETQNTEFRWGVAGAQDWTWDRINHWLNGGTFEREWEFAAGPTTLTLYSREDGCMLDCIFITDNLSDVLEEVNPREPTDEDLAAVEPGEKLTTAWGSIKSLK